MGILSGIFRSRDAPSNRTAGSAYTFNKTNSIKQDNLLFGCPKTIDITGFFKKCRITIRTIIRVTVFGNSDFFCSCFLRFARLCSCFH